MHWDDETLAAPSVDFPAGQPRQATDPFTGAYVPTAHAVARPWLQKYPLKQGTHATDRASAKVPGAHRLQIPVCPDVACPGGHLAHTPADSV